MLSAYRATSSQCRAHFSECGRGSAGRSRLGRCEDLARGRAVAPGELAFVGAHAALLHALRTLPEMRDVPAYMCSADAMPEDVARAEAAGFTGYWTKPINIVEVTTTLRDLARQRDNGTP